MLKIIMKEYLSNEKLIKFCRKLCTTLVRENNAPLDGIKVLDLTRIVAGPYCTMILGDLGADVVKVEKPGTGDESRKWGPPYVNDTQETCYFVCLNRNKRSICVDLKSVDGRNIIYNLAKSCDVLVENYVPGKLDGLKLGYDDLQSIAPHLIYCSITGYGSIGPYRNRPGYDVIAASLGGLLHSTGPQGGDPIKAGVAVTDLATGLYAHGAIMAALISRLKTGKGQKIDCNLLSTQIASLINIGSNYLNAGKEAKRWGTAHESIVPYQTFSTSDGYLTIGAGSDAQFYDLCSRINKNELIANPKFCTNKLRVKHREELVDLLQKTLKCKTKSEWMEKFHKATFPCGPVNTIQEVFDDPHVKSLGLVEGVKHPTTGKIKLVGPPVQYSGNDVKIRHPPPLLGQHTDEILGDILNYDRDHIATLRANNVIQ